MSHNITFKDVLENPDNSISSAQQWDWDYLSKNPNITMKDVLENPDKDWNWMYLSLNPNITMKDVLENPDKDWNWGWLSDNKFFYDDIVFNREYIKIRTKKKQLYTKKVLYENTDVCPDIINEITSWIVL